MRTKIQIKKHLLICLLLFAAPLTAHAYIDPGTGSLVLQMVIAGFVGASIGIKLFWKKIAAFFNKKKDN